MNNCFGLRLRLAHQDRHADERHDAYRAAPHANLRRRRYPRDGAHSHGDFVYGWTPRTAHSEAACPKRCGASTTKTRRTGGKSLTDSRVRISSTPRAREHTSPFAYTPFGRAKSSRPAGEEHRKGVQLACPHSLPFRAVF